MRIAAAWTAMLGLWLTFLITLFVSAGNSPPYRTAALDALMVRPALEEGAR